MARTITAAAKTESQAGIVRPINLVKFQFDGGDVRLTGADRNITFNGEVYSGVGASGTISAMSESSELQAANVRMTLSGIPSAYVSLLLQEAYSGRPVTVWIGFLDSNYQLVADPVVDFDGLIDQMTLVLGDTATITVTAEHEFVRWERPIIRRYTNDDQQDIYPNDRGLEYVSQMVEKQVAWGPQV